MTKTKCVLFRLFEYLRIGICFVLRVSDFGFKFGKMLSKIKLHECEIIELLPINYFKIEVK